jgi:hypothetical protein
VATGVGSHWQYPKKVIEIGVETDSAVFSEAVQSLTLAEGRAELTLTQIAAPAKLAQHAIAFAADVADEHISEHSDAGTGRFVLLHDDKPNEQWGSNYRIVAFAKSPLETLIGADEMISDVAWAWLMEALHNRGAKFSNEAGTTTRIISSGYGMLSNQSDHAELEMRLSWSPEGDFARHLEAWQDLICMMSGYPLLPAQVSPLRIRKH